MDALRAAGGIQYAVRAQRGADRLLRGADALPRGQGEVLRGQTAAHALCQGRARGDRGRAARIDDLSGQLYGRVRFDRDTAGRVAGKVDLDGVVGLDRAGDVELGTVDIAVLPPAARRIGVVAGLQEAIVAIRLATLVATAVTEPARCFMQVLAGDDFLEHLFIGLNDDARVDHGPWIVDVAIELPVAGVGRGARERDVAAERGAFRPFPARVERGLVAGADVAADAGHLDQLVGRVAQAATEFLHARLRGVGVQHMARRRRRRIADFHLAGVARQQGAVTGVDILDLERIAGLVVDIDLAEAAIDVDIAQRVGAENVAVQQDRAAARRGGDIIQRNLLGDHIERGLDRRVGWRRQTQQLRIDDNGCTTAADAVARRDFLQRRCQRCRQCQRPVGRLAGSDFAVDVDIPGRDRHLAAINGRTGFAAGQRLPDRAVGVGGACRILVAVAGAIINPAEVALLSGARDVHETTVEISGISEIRSIFDGTGNIGDGQVGRWQLGCVIAARPNHGLLPLGIWAAARVERSLAVRNLYSKHTARCIDIDLLAKDLAVLADGPGLVDNLDLATEVVDLAHQYQCRTVGDAAHIVRVIVLDGNRRRFPLAGLGQLHVVGQRRIATGRAGKQYLAARRVGDHGRVDQQVVGTVVNHRDFRRAVRRQRTRALQIGRIDGDGAAGRVQGTQFDRADGARRDPREHQLAGGRIGKTGAHIGRRIEIRVEGDGGRRAVGRLHDLAAVDAGAAAVVDIDRQVVIDAGVDIAVDGHVGGRRRAGRTATRGNRNEAQLVSAAGAVGLRVRRALVSADHGVLCTLDRGAAVDVEPRIAGQVRTCRRRGYGDQALDVTLGAGVAGQHGVVIARWILAGGNVDVTERADYAAATGNAHVLVGGEVHAGVGRTDRSQTVGFHQRRGAGRRIGVGTDADAAQADELVAEAGRDIAVEQCRGARRDAGAGHQTTGTEDDRVSQAHVVGCAQHHGVRRRRGARPAGQGDAVAQADGSAGGDIGRAAGGSAVEHAAAGAGSGFASAAGIVVEHVVGQYLDGAGGRQLAVAADVGGHRHVRRVRGLGTAAAHQRGVDGIGMVGVGVDMVDADQHCTGVDVGIAADGGVHVGIAARAGIGSVAGNDAASGGRRGGGIGVDAGRIDLQVTGAARAGRGVIAQRGRSTHAVACGAGFGTRHRAAGGDQACAGDAGGRGLLGAVVDGGNTDVTVWQRDIVADGGADLGVVAGHRFGAGARQQQAAGSAGGSCFNGCAAGRNGGRRQHGQQVVAGDGAAAAQGGGHRAALVGMADDHADGGRACCRAHAVRGHAGVVGSGHLHGAAGGARVGAIGMCGHLVLDQGVGYGSAQTHQAGAAGIGGDGGGRAAAILGHGAHIHAGGADVGLDDGRIDGAVDARDAYRAARAQRAAHGDCARRVGGRGRRQRVHLHGAAVDGAAGNARRDGVGVKTVHGCLDVERGRGALAVLPVRCRRRLRRQGVHLGQGAVVALVEFIVGVAGGATAHHQHAKRAADTHGGARAAAGAGHVDGFVAGGRDGHLARAVDGAVDQFCSHAAFGHHHVGGSADTGACACCNSAGQRLDGDGFAGGHRHRTQRRCQPAPAGAVGCHHDITVRIGHGDRRGCWRCRQRLHVINAGSGAVLHDGDGSRTSHPGQAAGAAAGDRAGEPVIGQRRHRQCAIERQRGGAAGGRRMAHVGVGGAAGDADAEGAADAGDACRAGHRQHVIGVRALGVHGKTVRRELAVLHVGRGIAAEHGDRARGGAGHQAGCQTGDDIGRRLRSARLHLDRADRRRRRHGAAGDGGVIDGHRNAFIEIDVGTRRTRWRRSDGFHRRRHGPGRSRADGGVGNVGTGAAVGAAGRSGSRGGPLSGRGAHGKVARVGVARRHHIDVGASGRPGAGVDLGAVDEGAGRAAHQVDHGHNCSADAARDPHRYGDIIDTLVRRGVDGQAAHGQLGFRQIGGGIARRLDAAEVDRMYQLPAVDGDGARGVARAGVDPRRGAVDICAHVAIDLVESAGHADACCATRAERAGDDRRLVVAEGQHAHVVGCRDLGAGVDERGHVLGNDVGHHRTAHAARAARRTGCCDGADGAGGRGLYQQVVHGQALGAGFFARHPRLRRLGVAGAADHIDRQRQACRSSPTDSARAGQRIDGRRIHGLDLDHGLAAVHFRVHQLCVGLVGDVVGRSGASAADVAATRAGHRGRLDRCRAGAADVQLGGLVHTAVVQARGDGRGDAVICHCRAKAGIGAAADCTGQRSNRRVVGGVDGNLAGAARFGAGRDGGIIQLGTGNIARQADLVDRDRAGQPDFTGADAQRDGGALDLAVELARKRQRIDAGQRAAGNRGAAGVVDAVERQGRARTDFTGRSGGAAQRSNDGRIQRAHGDRVTGGSGGGGGGGGGSASVDGAGAHRGAGAVVDEIEGQRTGNGIAVRAGRAGNGGSVDPGAIIGRHTNGVGCCQLGVDDPGSQGIGGVDLDRGRFQHRLLAAGSAADLRGHAIVDEIERGRTGAGHLARRADASGDAEDAGVSLGQHGNAAARAGGLDGGVADGGAGMVVDLVPGQRDTVIVAARKLHHARHSGDTAAGRRRAAGGAATAVIESRRDTVALAVGVDRVFDGSVSAAVRGLDGDVAGRLDQGSATDVGAGVIANDGHDGGPGVGIGLGRLGSTDDGRTRSDLRRVERAHANSTELFHGGIVDGGSDVVVDLGIAEGDRCRSTGFRTFGNGCPQRTAAGADVVTVVSGHVQRGRAAVGGDGGMGNAGAGDIAGGVVVVRQRLGDRDRADELVAGVGILAADIDCGRNGHRQLFAGGQRLHGDVASMSDGRVRDVGRGAVAQQVDGNCTGDTAVRLAVLGSASGNAGGTAAGHNIGIGHGTHGAAGASKCQGRLFLGGRRSVDLARCRIGHLAGRRCIGRRQREQVDRLGCAVMHALGQGFELVADAGLAIGRAVIRHAAGRRGGPDGTIRTRLDVEVAHLDRGIGHGPLAGARRAVAGHGVVVGNRRLRLACHLVDGDAHAHCGAARIIETAGNRPQHRVVIGFQQQLAGADRRLIVDQRAHMAVHLVECQGAIDAERTARAAGGRQRNHARIAAGVHHHATGAARSAGIPRARADGADAGSLVHTIDRSAFAHDGLDVVVERGLADGSPQPGGTARARRLAGQEQVRAVVARGHRGRCRKAEGLGEGGHGAGQAQFAVVGHGGFQFERGGPRCGRRDVGVAAQVQLGARAQLGARIVVHRQQANRTVNAFRVFRVVALGGGRRGAIEHGAGIANVLEGGDDGFQPVVAGKWRGGVAAAGQQSVADRHAGVSADSDFGCRDDGVVAHGGNGIMGDVGNRQAGRIGVLGRAGSALIGRLGHRRRRRANLEVGGDHARRHQYRICGMHSSAGSNGGGRRVLVPGVRNGAANAECIRSGRRQVFLRLDAAQADQVVNLLFRRTQDDRHAGSVADVGVQRRRGGRLVGGISHRCGSLALAARDGFRFVDVVADIGGRQRQRAGHLERGAMFDARGGIDIGIGAAESDRHRILAGIVDVRRLGLRGDTGVVVGANGEVGGSDAGTRLHHHGGLRCIADVRGADAEGGRARHAARIVLVRNAGLGLVFCGELDRARRFEDAARADRHGGLGHHVRVHQVGAQQVGHLVQRGLHAGQRQTGSFVHRIAVVDVAAVDNVFCRQFDIVGLDGGLAERDAAGGGGHAQRRLGHVRGGRQCDFAVGARRDALIIGQQAGAVRQCDRRRRQRDVAGCTARVERLDVGAGGIGVGTDIAARQYDVVEPDRLVGLQRDRRAVVAQLVTGAAGPRDGGRIDQHLAGLTCGRARRHATTIDGDLIRRAQFDKATIAAGTGAGVEHGALAQRRVVGAKQHDAPAVCLSALPARRHVGARRHHDIVARVCVDLSGSGIVAVHRHAAGNGHVVAGDNFNHPGMVDQRGAAGDGAGIDRAQERGLVGHIGAGTHGAVDADVGALQADDVTRVDHAVDADHAQARRGRRAVEQRADRQSIDRTVAADDAIDGLASWRGHRQAAHIQNAGAADDHAERIGKDHVAADAAVLEAVDDAVHRDRCIGHHVKQELRVRRHHQIDRIIAVHLEAVERIERRGPVQGTGRDVGHCAVDHQLRGRGPFRHDDILRKTHPHRIAEDRQQRHDQRRRACPVQAPSAWLLGGGGDFRQNRHGVFLDTKGVETCRDVRKQRPREDGIRLRADWGRAGPVRQDCWLRYSVGMDAVDPNCQRRDLLEREQVGVDQLHVAAAHQLHQRGIVECLQPGGIDNEKAIDDLLFAVRFDFDGFRHQHIKRGQPLSEQVGLLHFGVIQAQEVHRALQHRRFPAFGIEERLAVFLIQTRKSLVDAHGELVGRALAFGQHERIAARKRRDVAIGLPAAIGFQEQVFLLAQPDHRRQCVGAAGLTDKDDRIAHRCIHQFGRCDQQGIGVLTERKVASSRRQLQIAMALAVECDRLLVKDH
uniref:Uncharacterized protein n=1 Tax=Tanacetum cinerariifolium TaxID=118510 RepID=A0A699GFF6_TANCI|nr:hypothetical protein [Tanacetum cinerariifolium]